MISLSKNSKYSDLAAISYSVSSITTLNKAFKTFLSIFPKEAAGFKLFLKPSARFFGGVGLAWEINILRVSIIPICDLYCLLAVIASNSSATRII